MSYEPQVNTASDPDGVYTGNALRFATEQEAKDYVFDLAMRWTAVRDTRVIVSEDPVNKRIVEGVMEDSS
jgi:hypothetical protein